MLANISHWNLLLILIVLLLLFGRRLPEIANSLGRSYREFRRGLAGAEEEFKKGAADESRPVADAPKPPDGGENRA